MNIEKLFFTISIILAMAFQSVFVLAQSPQKVSYQMVVRDASGELVKESTVGVKMSILQGSSTGSAVYVETHAPQSNVNGLISLEVGSGTPEQNTFEGIDWVSGPYFLKAEIDPAGGSSYSISGTSEILSVPYALHAQTVTSVPSGTQTGEMQYWDGSQWITFAPGDDGATLTLVNGVPTWKKNITTATVTTKAITNIAQTTATGGGNVTDDGGADVTARGVVYSTNETPTLVRNDGITADGTGTGEYTSSLTGLTAGFIYYVRAYVTNSEGTTYGQQVSFTALTEGGGGSTEVIEVTNPATGKTWMDRNLGAIRAATSSTDANAYGELYQWGRADDGHEKRTSGTTPTLSTTDTPGHGDFILAPDSPYDWRSPQNGNLWQGVSGANNPCPGGYRLPTEAEWDAERLSWAPNNNSTGAFASPLKLPVAGYRGHSAGSLLSVGSIGFYWSSTVEGISSRGLYFHSSGAGKNSYYRADGLSVRCIKD